MDSKNSFLQDIANNFDLSIKSKMIFAEPIEHNGTKIVPVAKVYYGYGGGQGKQGDDNIGNGYGGGVSSKPVGYIIFQNGNAIFKPIRVPASTTSIIFTTGLAGYLLFKGISLLFKK